MPDAVQREARSLYRMGGISALVLGVAYLVITAVYIWIGAPPSDTKARLAYIAANTAAWWTIVSLSVLTDFLFVPVALSLFTALQEVNRNLMLFATACVMLFVVLDLSITWTNYASLITLSGKYAKAANETLRANIITAAEYPCAVLQSSLLFVYNTLVLAVGILITGFVMLRGVFSKSIACLGLATGVLAIVSVLGSFFFSALSVLIILASVLTTLWVLFVGYRLYRLATADPGGSS